MRRRPLAALLAVVLLAGFVLVLGPERVARDLSRADLRLVALTGLPVATVGAAVLLYRATGDGFSALLGGAGVAVGPGVGSTPTDREE